MKTAQRTAVEQLEQLFQTLPGSFALVDETIQGHWRFPIADFRFGSPDT
jgi:hypothetical protein